MKPNTIILGFCDGEDLRKDDFEDPTSDFVSEKLATIFPKMSSGFAGESGDEMKRIQKRVEFVRSIRDVLKLRKNVCVCRNFQELDRHVSGLDPLNENFDCNLLSTWSCEEIGLPIFFSKMLLNCNLIINHCQLQTRRIQSKWSQIVPVLSPVPLVHRRLAHGLLRSADCNPVG